MRTISTGEPATLGTYLKIAKFFGKGAEAFMRKKIDESPMGENEEVIADESQMLYLLGSFLQPVTDEKQEELDDYFERMGI